MAYAPTHVNLRKNCLEYCDMDSAFIKCFSAIVLVMLRANIFVFCVALLCWKNALVSDCGWQGLWKWFFLSSK